MPAKLEMLKMAVNFVTGAGVTKIVNDIISNNTTTETAADTAKVLAGSVVIGSMVADAASKHVDARMDAIAAKFSKLKDKKTEE